MTTKFATTDNGIQIGRPRSQSVSFVSQVEELMAEKQNFAQCVAEHVPFLNRMIRNLTRGDQMAEDIVQQTVLKALVHADQFRFESSMKTWLSSIAINEVNQAYRSKSRARLVPFITENIELDRHHRVEFPNHSYEARSVTLLCGTPSPAYRSCIGPL